MRILIYETDPASAIGLPVIIKKNINNQIIIDTSDDINNTLELIRTNYYDLLLINLDDELDINIGTEIKEINPLIKILLLSSNREQNILKIIADGFNGIWIKGKEIKTLIEAIQIIKDKQDSFYLDPKLTPIIRDKIKQLSRFDNIDNKKTEEILNSLTPKELEVLSLVINGFKDGKICEELDIKIPTFKSHMLSIRNKLHVKSKSDLITKCWLTGLAFQIRSNFLTPLYAV